MELHQLHPLHTQHEESNEALFTMYELLSYKPKIVKSFNKLDFTISNPFREYFISRLNSNIQSDTRKQYRKKLKMKTSDMRDMAIIAPPGFGVKLLKVAKILKVYAMTTIHEVEETGGLALNEIDKYMGTHDYRSKLFNDTEAIDKVSTRIGITDRAISDLFVSKETGVIHLGEMFDTVADIEEVATIMSSIAIDETDLKYHLNRISALKARIELASDISELKANTAARGVLVKYIETLANGYTLVGKIYYVYFEILKILLDIKRLDK